MTGIIERLLLGPPSLLIGDQSDPYLRRWHIRPRTGTGNNVYLHHIRRSDSDTPHDHPWKSVSLMLWGSLIEHYLATDGTMKTRKLRVGSIVIRGADFAHWLEVLPGTRGAWTLFLTGPKIRNWGFHCPKGWRPWWEFAKSKSPGEIGRGCE